MSTRESVIKKIEIIPEELLQRVIELIGMYDEETKEPVVFTDELMTRIDEGLRKGMESINAGRTLSLEEVDEKMQRLYKKHGL
jgi:hypothetical protein